MTKGRIELTRRLNTSVLTPDWGIQRQGTPEVRRVAHRHLTDMLGLLLLVGALTLATRASFVAFFGFPALERITAFAWMLLAFLPVALPAYFSGVPPINAIPRMDPIWGTVSKRG